MGHASPDVSPLSWYFSFGCFGREGVLGTPQAGPFQSCCLRLVTEASSTHTPPRGSACLARELTLGLGFDFLFSSCAGFCFFFDFGSSSVNFLVLLMCGNGDAISSGVAPDDKIDIHIHSLRRALIPI